MTIDLLERLRPEDVHPARLAGPHAWARWGLGPSPPVDAPLRFAVPADTTDETTQRIIGTIEGRLQRATWPPRPSLATTRTDSGLEVACGPAHTTITVRRTPAAASVRGSGPVTDPEGWFILDETAALADRLTEVHLGGNADVFEDLARWAALKGDAIDRHRATEPSIPGVLVELRRQAPEASARLDALLDAGSAPDLTTPLQHGLRLLRDEAESLRRMDSARRAAAMR